MTDTFFLADLAAWVDSTHMDSNSVSIAPSFYALPDLHNPDFALQGLGDPNLGIADDIDGDMRDPVAPDLGADESTWMAPVAQFFANPTELCVDLPVQFVDQSQNLPTHWAWDIDNDGTTDYTTQDPSHAYRDCSVGGR